MKTIYLLLGLSLTLSCHLSANNTSQTTHQLAQTTEHKTPSSKEQGLDTSATTDEQEIPLLARNSVQYRGLVNPEEFPSFALMRAFIGKLYNQYNGEFGEIFVNEMFKKMGVNQTSIDALNLYANQMMADYEILFRKPVICEQFNKTKAATTKAHLATVINQHDYNRRHFFTIAYDNLHQILEPSELKKFQHYLKTEYVKNITYIHSKPIKPDAVEIEKLRARCVRKGYIQ